MAKKRTTKLTLWHQPGLTTRTPVSKTPQVIEAKSVVPRTIGITSASTVALSAKEHSRAVGIALSPKAIAGGGSSTGRLTYDRPEDQYKSTLGIFAKLAPDSLWRGLSLDSRTLDRIRPEQLMELLADLSPEMSRAVFDFILMCNPGYELQAVYPGTERPHTQGQKVLDESMRTLGSNYGIADIVLNRLIITVALRGALLSEVVFNDSGDFVDMATPDPFYIVFKKVWDDIRGMIRVPAQWQKGELVELTRPTIKYIPLHPFPGKPEGRALYSSALFTCLFLLSLLHDLRRVIAQQGYPRLDLAIDFEKLVAVMPEADQKDPDAFQSWADAVTDEVARAYGNLQPDQAYVHSSIVTVNKPVGALDSNSLGMLDKLFTAIERMCTRALKTMPLLMASNDGVSEANANRQWEIHAAGIKSIQHLVENLIEYDFNLVLQAAGVAAEARMRFAELRAAELFRDAQVGLLRATIARYAYDAGWISQDEAAKLGADKDKADAPEPRTAAPKPSASPTGEAAATDPTQTQADPGSNRINDMVFQSALRLVMGNADDRDKITIRGLLNLDSPTTESEAVS